MRARALLIGAAALIGWQTGAAQAAGAGAGEDSTRATARRRFWVRPVASFLLPGSGQWMSHQNRAAAYLAAEAYTLVRYLQLLSRGRTGARAFRDLAFNVARSAFAPPAAARDTAFEYFETMERYMASGRFNQGPGPALLPETDTTTYNGAVWRLARRTYWPNPDTPPDPASPEYASALQFYAGHAVGDGYRWSWNGADSALQVYRATITKSDNAFRSAQDQLGLLLANHVASAVDALISNRVAGAIRRPASFRTTLGPGSVTVDLSVGF